MSYWATWKPGAEKWFAEIDGDALAIVNPESGALDRKTLGTSTPMPSTALRRAMDVAVWNPSRRARILAYVPTGYFCQTASIHSTCTADRVKNWNAVGAQVSAYLNEEGNCPQAPCGRIDGFFFDEVHPGDTPNPDFNAEFGRLRALAKRDGRTFLLAFNVGEPRRETLGAAVEGEIVVTLENPASEATDATWSDVTRLNADLAARRIGSWVMLYRVPCGVPLSTHWERLAASAPTYGYSTQDGTDGNPWDEPSAYMKLGTLEPCP